MNRRQKIRNCFKNQEKWLTCKDIEKMLPGVKTKTISSYLCQLSNDGFLERKPVFPLRKRRGSPMKYKLPENNTDAKRKSASNELLTKLVNELVQEKILFPIEERERILKIELDIAVKNGLYFIAAEYKTRLNETEKIKKMFIKRFL